MGSVCVSTKDGVVEGPAEYIRNFDVTEERVDKGNRGDDNGEVRLKARALVSTKMKNGGFTSVLTCPIHLREYSRPNRRLVRGPR